MKIKSRQWQWMFRLASLMFASALFMASIAPSWALAQSTDESWDEPLNISQSGIAAEPAFVIDSEGLGHATWQDDSGNIVYSRFAGDQWSKPETTDLNRLFQLPIPGEPLGASQVSNYTGSNPLFLPGPSRFLFGFWISPEGKLFTSRVRGQNFEHFVSWDSGRLIANGAASFAVTVDPSGGLHLAYIRVVDHPKQPAGIYYTRSKDSGYSWTVPVLLYESSYFRTLGEGQANLSVAATETEGASHVYIAWDNRPRKQVFLAQSADGGLTWEQPALVAGPAEPGSGSDDPFNIQVGATQNSVVLVWQSGRAANGLVPACRQLFQFSSDAGATWSDTLPMIEDLFGCSQPNQFVVRPVGDPESPLYFLTETTGQVFLSAWNGLQWSQPQAQPILSGFEEPEIYTEVIFRCHRPALLGERLYVVGCDQGGGGDVWVTSGDLSTNTAGFEAPEWSQPSPVATDGFEMEDIALVSTDDGSIHTFINQHRDPAIYYTYWNGKLWSRVTPVVTLPEGEAGWPAVATGPGNELFLFAPSSMGALYFSRAVSGNAIAASNWSTPTRLELAHDGEIGSVAVAWSAAGTVYVAYSVPVNDERGIYLIQSQDSGTTWSEPIRVFDGAVEGFDVVGSPSLLISENGFLHITWKQQSIQGDGVPQPLSLYYARSEDGGRTFVDAQMVVDEPVAWREIVTDDKGNLHLLWQPQNMLTTVWAQASLDGGRSWQFPQGLPDQGTVAAVTADSAGRLHLVDAGSGFIGHWLWDGSRWKSEPSLNWSLASQQEGPVDLLAATVNKQGQMVVLLSVPSGPADTAERTLLYSIRTLDLPSGTTATKQAPTQALLSPTLPAVTLTPEESSTTPPSTIAVEPTDSQGQTGGNETNNPISPFTIAAVPVALLLLGVLGFVIRRAARANDR